MHEINWLDESFDIKHASDYHLSIQIGLDGFSFCIMDTLRNKYVAFQHNPLIVGKLQFLPRKIETILDQEEKLNASFKSVSVTYSTNKATLVPKEYSEDDAVQKIASLTSDISRNESIRTDDIPGFHYKLTYSFPNEIISLLNRKYTDFSFRHKSIPLISSVAGQRNEKKNTLLVNFEKKYIRIIAFNETQLVLYNCFYFKNESDFLYYTLNVWQNLQFDPERDEVHIGGYVADDSSFVRHLKKYISNILFLKPATGINYGNLFSKIQKHQFVSLLNTFPCV